MQILKTDRKIFLTNELKSWLWIIALTLLLYSGFKLFSTVPPDTFLIGIAVIILLKFGDTLTQYYVKEIRIDAQKHQLIFVLNSLLSGQETRICGLQQAKSKLVTNSTLPSFFHSRLMLKISLSKKEFFQIKSRYGFSKETLVTIDNAINNFEVK